MTANPKPEQMTPWRALVALVWTSVLSTVSLAASADPPVPPGRDTGGVAIAVIGPGLDYRAPQIAQRLARDGEGELVGYDLIDNDRRPFETAGPVTAIAGLLLERDRSLTLEPFRARVSEPAELARAIAMVAGTRARIVVILPATLRSEDWALLTEASARFPQLLIVLPVLSAEMPRGARVPLELPNVLVTAALQAGAVASGISNPEARQADLGIIAESVELAAAVAIAQAAALLSADAAMSGKDLRSKLLATATPWLAGGAGPRHGSLPASALSAPHGK